MTQDEQQSGGNAARINNQRPFDFGLTIGLRSLAVSLAGSLLCAHRALLFPVSGGCDRAGPLEVRLL